MSQAPPTSDPVIRDLESALEGRYLLERELGRGGMGAVFLARDVALDRLVAIKVLPPELAVRPELRERFLRETRTAASFSHPNIVPVHAVEETGSVLFFVMGFVEGETLGQKVRRQGPLTAQEATRLIQEVAWALSYAHGRGVIHRDVKPDNILIERATGRALVTDFGIARSVAASGLTQVGETVGTPHFMSPEQAVGEALDGRSDLYSLGVVGYFAVTARLPFEADSGQAVLTMHLTQAPRAVAEFRPDLPTPLSMAIDRCLAKEPADRFASGEALVESLESVRGRHAEVAPVIRIFVNKANQFARNAFLIMIFGWQLAMRGRNDLEEVVFTAMFLVVVLALLSQIPLGMRDLARQGLDYNALLNGIRTIDAERAAAITAQRAAPGQQHRDRRTTLILLLCVGLSLALGAYGIATRVHLADGGVRFTLPGTLTLFLSISLGLASIVFFAARMARDGKFDQRLNRLWSGSVGGWLFRLGSWRLGTRGSHAGGFPGVLTLLESLPPDRRRALRRVRGLIERLEQEVSQCVKREQELDDTLGETRHGSAPLPDGVTDRQQALVRDLEQARRAAGERRLQLLAAGENLRLGLLRVRSGIGDAGDIVREVEATLGTRP